MIPIFGSDFNRPLAAFYAYSAACGVFSCVSTGLFMPIFLEQLARSHGRMEPLRTLPCDNAPADAMGNRCSVSIMGTWVDTASYSLYAKSINVALQAITLISISVLADIPIWRNRLIIAFATTGSTLATTFLILPTGSRASLYIAAALVIVSSVCLSDSFVCLNAFLPELGRSAGGQSVQLADSPEPQEGTALIRSVARTSAEIMEVSITYPDEAPYSEPLDDTAIVGHPPHHRVQAKLSVISSRGIAISFASGVSLLALSLIPILITHGSLRALRSVIGASGVVWALLTFIVWLLLRQKGSYVRVPGAEGGGAVSLVGTDGGDREGWEVVKRKVGEGWQRVGMLVNGKEIRRLRVTYWYLLASALLQDGTSLLSLHSDIWLIHPRFLFSDVAFNTTLAVSILFAKTTLSMSPAQVILVGLMMQLTAVGSAAITPAMQKRYALDGVQSILVCVAMGTGMCAYGLLGLVCPWFGLRSSWEMYLCAIWFGMLYGPYDAMARSVLVDFIPSGQEARFFSLFSITDKSASFLGPAAIALVADWTGEIRYGFAVLAVLMVVPVPILVFLVDVERGRKDARLL
ncbi:hypothetical protein QFC19_006435 [Naganishia cerealis]|uniref:Uncharacterized protein n=1 Tax=Naganishia cerealis TaxID=610337 RepID=A0ACC2VHM9_9TREE|nr:hypothetical protein QFC19_006435 [Naganishia cerealis]